MIVFVRKNASKAKRLAFGSPSPKKCKANPSDKLPGRQYHFYERISRMALMEVLLYSQQQQHILADMHGTIDENSFYYNEIK